MATWPLPKAFTLFLARHGGTYCLSQHSEVRLFYRVSSGTVRAIQRNPIFKTKQTNKGQSTRDVQRTCLESVLPLHPVGPWDFHVHCFWS